MIPFFRTVLDLLFPPRCGGCGALLPPSLRGEERALCTECAEEWEREMRLQCPECLADYEECTCQPRALKKAGCTAFVKLAPYGDEPRERVVRHLILEMKKSPRPRLAAFLAKELADGVLKAIERAGFDKSQALLLHLPRARKALRRYGVDQAQELARALCAETGIPCTSLLYRKKSAKPQKKLDAKARAVNLAEAFGVREVPRDKLLILVDDVVTTGATLGVAASLLRAAGAKSVIAVAVAQTEKKQKR